MRTVWIKVDPWDKDIVTCALEGGAHGLVLPPGYSEKAKRLGRITTIAEDGDLVPGKDVVFFEIKDGSDEDEIVRLTKDHKVVLECPDWTIIPLENLIAKGADVIPVVHSMKEAETAFGILEKGVAGILYVPEDVSDLKNALNVLCKNTETIALQEASIIEILPVGMGDRVCIDTCTSMGIGQGMLVGNSSSALFLVHAESIENPYVAPRPFRVNAGPVHAYTRVPGGKTRYLSELSAGDPVLITDYKGETQPAVVGRLKIEKRPLMLVRAEVDGVAVTTILQNAETIRLTTPDGEPVSIVFLGKGDKVLVATEQSGRHFGMKIEETIVER